MYADYTSLMISAHNITSLSLSATEELQRVQQWFQDNGLSLNISKTNFILFNYLNRSHDHSLLLRSVHTSIEQVDAAKFLGIHIHSGLKWNIHVDQVCKKIASVTYSISQLRFIVDRPLLRIYYFAYLHSIICYGIIAWSGSTEPSRIFIMQKRIIRLISCVIRKESCRDLIKNLGILSVPCVYILEHLIYAKVKLSDLPKLGDHSNYPTRSSLVLQIPPHRRATTKKARN
nr:unnamed protein product [Callosobruchus analis]